jgi:hypothetical protein
VAAEYANVRKVVEQFRVSKIELIDEEQKYDKLSCHTCRHYQYLSMVKCSCCQQKYCLEHAHRCCGKRMVLMMREADLSRKKTMDLAKSSLK